MRRRRWVMAGESDQAHATLGAYYSPLLARALWARQLRTRALCETWLTAHRAEWRPWHQMPDMNVAVARVSQALTAGQPIAIFGDYDVDGLTSTAILVLALQAMGSEVAWRLPNRLREGYGLNAEAVYDLAGRLRERQPDGRALLIAVDCGTSNHAEIEIANDLGLDVVVLDHHVAADCLPAALVVVNPRRGDQPYPNRDLTAAGLALDLARGLLDAHAVSLTAGALCDFKRDLMALAALGTIADVAPLTGENRVLVAAGLGALRLRQRPGLAALMRVAGVDTSHISSSAVSWRLAPRLNAAGRVSRPDIGLQLLLTEDAAEAERLANQLEELNRQRQNDLERILSEARGYAQVSPRRIPVLVRDGWSPGLAGLVAGRLTEEIGRPVIVLGSEGDVARGSARSIEGFNIMEALDRCRHLLRRVGGHSQAAGLTVDVSQVEGLAHALDDIAASAWADAVPELCLRLDGVARLPELRYEAVADLKRLEPFGRGNEEPVWLVAGVQAREARQVGHNGQHLQFRIHDGTTSTRCIAFGQGERLPELLTTATVDLACTAVLDEWQGSVRVQLQVRDFRSAATSAA